MFVISFELQNLYISKKLLLILKEIPYLNIQNIRKECLKFSSKSPFQNSDTCQFKSQYVRIVVYTK